MYKKGIDTFYYFGSIWNTSSFIMNLDKKIGYLMKYFVISELKKQKDYLTKENRSILLSYIKNVKEIKNKSKNEELEIDCDYYIDFVQKIYNKTNNEDLNGNITFQTSKRFLLIADMIEVFRIFGIIYYGMLFIYIVFF